MKVRCFYPNKYGKIEFTKEQLEKLLDEVYEEGRAKGYAQGYADGKPTVINYPYTPYWWTSTSSSPSITCSNDKEYVTISGSGQCTCSDTTATINAVNVNEPTLFVVGNEK